MDRIAARARITGHVQGVAYRAWTRGRARALGLTGWVKNCDDGSVRAWFEGDPEAVQTMLKELWDGPGAAVVTDVRSEEAEPQGRFRTFEITG